MRAAPRWEMSPAAAEAGQEATLQIVDQEDGPDGRTVCIIPGNLSRRLAAGEFVRLLDQQIDSRRQQLARTLRMMHRRHAH